MPERATPDVAAITSTHISADDHAAAINTDRPCVTLAEDAFDFEPTVRAIARTIRLAPAPRGLVLHIDGEWGAGKSSALAFVKQVLREDSPPGRAPTFLDFSPWWFGDREDLAQQYLQQLRLELQREDPTLMKAGALIAQYSDQLGHVVGAGLSAAVGMPIPGASKVIAAGFRKLKPADKTLPELKTEICEHLAQAQRRIVVFIDDVDRLAPVEIEQLFRVIKAVADFPNVVYVLAFDSTQVARALEAQLKVDGRPYLEKIVQVPFLLPIPTTERLSERLEARVRAIAGADLPNDLYTRRVLKAMAKLVRRPRDLARFANAYACTYPVVAGEVHAADAAALDLLRVLGLQVFWAIRDHHDEFIGVARSGEGAKAKEDQPDFHAVWRREVSDKRARAVGELIGLLFPNLSPQKWVRQSADSQRLLSAEGRVASPWGHSVYFHLRTPDWALTHRRRDELLGITDPQVLLDEWQTLTLSGRRDGLSLAADLVVEVSLADVSPGFARAFVLSVLRVGEGLYQSGDGSRLDIDVVARVFVHCVERLDVDRLSHVLEAFDAATSLVAVTRIVRHYRTWMETANPPFVELPGWLDARAYDQMAKKATSRIVTCAQEGTLLAQPSAAIGLLPFWSQYERDASIAWLRLALADDAMLVDLLEGLVFSQESSEPDSPRTDYFQGEPLARMLPPDRNMAGLLTDIERVAASGARPLQPRANRLAPHLRGYVREYPATTTGASEPQAGGDGADTHDAGGESS